MNITILLNAFALYLNDNFHKELDQVLKPKDSAQCETCKRLKYDFIIVGAGAAGCVLANRLSENPKWNVLLIEAGGDEDYITDIPAMGGLFTGTKYDWNYTTVRQEVACQDDDGYCKFPLGHVMGGSSTIGDMKYIRGSPTDFDKWSELGNQGWSYKDVLPYFLKSENITMPGADLPESIYHNSRGLIPVSHGHFNSSVYESFVDIAGDVGFVPIDYNGTYGVGIGYRLTTEGGMRKSASKAYLNPIRDRPNLHIYKNTLVTKILLSNDGNRKALGVACVTDEQEYEVYSSREVILSAGAINTPKLLLLSGIGPKKHLEELDIPVYADLPVGENLVDHPGVKHRYQTNVTELIYDDNSLMEAILDYVKYRKGVLSFPQYTVVGFDNAMHKGDNHSELTALYVGGYALPDLSFKGDSKFITLINAGRFLSTLSKGTVKLKSKNYKDPPLIDPKYFSNKEDLEHFTHITYLMLTFFEDTRWTKYNPKLVTSQCKFNGSFNEEFLYCHLQMNSYVGLYPSSTAKMGPASDKTSVVDSNLKVHHVDNLRVVDASIIPIPVRGILIATVEMIAEKASDIIIRNQQK